jgi:hypothetical protein
VLSLFDIESVVDDLIEEKILAEEISSEQIDDIRAIMLNFTENKINLNNTNYSELKQLIFLNNYQIFDLLKYKNEVKLFKTIYELRMIPSLNMKVIKTLLHFVYVGEKKSYKKDSLEQILSKARHKLYVGYYDIVQKQQGIENGNYGGESFSSYVNYDVKYFNKFRIHFNLQKDKGEPMFNNDKFPIYDYLSFSSEVNDYRWFDKIIIGNMKISMGQGLICSNTFPQRKTSDVTNLQNRNNTLAMDNSMTEYAKFSGIGFLSTLSENIRLVGFGSYNKIDASFDDHNSNLIKTIYESGLHRTEKELNDKNSVSVYNVGVSFKLNFGNQYVSANLINTKFSNAFLQKDDIAYMYDNHQKNILNTSIDYSFTYNHLNFLGEFAYSKTQNIDFASISSLSYEFIPNFVALISYRNYGKAYRAYYANPLSESKPNNEQGIYIGLSYSPSKNLIINSYVDNYKYLHPTFSKSPNSKGTEYLLKADYFYSKKIQIYYQTKYEKYERNSPEDEYLQEFIMNNRLNFKYILWANFILTNRVEFSNFNEEKDGFLFYQDVKYNSEILPLTIRFRYTYFDTDFDSRIYAYESDLKHYTTIPGFVGNGNKWSLTSKYKLNDKLRLAIKISNISYFDKEVIGSGNDLIESNNKTEYKFELYYKF